MDKQGRILLPAYLRDRSASSARSSSSAHRITRRSGHRTGGTPTGRSSTTRWSWPGPSKALASSSHHMRFQDPLGIRSVPDGGEMHEGHLPVLANEVIEMLAPAPGSLHIDATLGGGGHTERILEAANPDGRLLGLDADPAAIARVEARLRPRFGDRLVLRQANFRDLATVAPAAGLRERRRLPVRPRAVELPAGRPRSRLRLPGRRPARHALRCRPRRPGRRAAGDPRCRRADRPLPPLRRGAEGAADRPRDRRGPAGRADHDGRGAGRADRARRAAQPAAAPPDPSRRRASSRPSGSRSTRSSRRSRRVSPPRSTCSIRAAGSSS